ncbi:uncharacterized protein LOC134211668 [Armigeres subalbatus]|uniref:uncharacterized protein LOC134211668 n=1 Tax=Armigeres subalbatus TaxID=124917 RepID=UPI002ED035EB
MQVISFKTLLIVQVFYGIQGSISSPYRIYEMVPEGICKTRRIPLLDNFIINWDPITLSNPEMGAIFRQTWNSSSFKRFAECKFYVQAPPKMGLYLTISTAKLRKNSRGHCIDSIVVKKSNDKKYTFCDALDDDDDDDELKVFSDDHGKIRVTINLDTTLALPTLNDTLEVQLIATVKRSCNYLDASLAQCEEDDYDSCISKDFFGDGYVNCPECEDEKSCFKESQQVQIVNPSNVFLSAIISLFATMVVFGGCLWCLYKYRNCIGNCNSNSAGTARTDQNARVVAAEQMQVELQSSANELQPSAPPNDDKDLPPTYESLFPTSPSGRTN